MGRLVVAAAPALLALAPHTLPKAGAPLPGARLADVAVASANGTAAAPELVPWAWHRREDLRFLAPGSTVAALVGTLELAGDDVVVAPRLQPLLVAPGAVVLPVVRVEVSRPVPPQLSRGLASQAAAAIARLARGSAVQVDFDATLSQRPFQRELLLELRRRLPAPAFVSVTALASTCLDGSAASLPADEVVPMLFRMGPDTAAVLRRIARRGGLPPPCATAVGLATDEPAPTPPGIVRVFLFAPRSWDRATFDRARLEISR
jgi:hypothetical protein